VTVTDGAAFLRSRAESYRRDAAVLHPDGDTSSAAYFRTGASELDEAAGLVES
jgi:hypothetical protein